MIGNTDLAWSGRSTGLIPEEVGGGGLPNTSQIAAGGLLLLEVLPRVLRGASTRLRRIMLANSWNYAFMDSRIMLTKSSLLCFGTQEYAFTFLYLWSLKVWKIVRFSYMYLQVAIIPTKYMSIPLPRCPCMQEINKERENIASSIHYNFFCKKIFHC